MSRKEFLGRLRKGYALQLNVGMDFLAEGFIVHVHPYQEHRADEYDILVKPTDRSHWREIEVKGHGKPFTTVDDFLYESVFVETVRRWDGRESPPEYYVIVSYQTGAAFGIHSSTHPHWTSIRTRDSQKNLYDDFLTCPKELCTPWDEMVGKLRGRL